MDPLTALGLASNILQFVDFTWKLVSETRTIYKSATGSGKDNELLETIVTDVNRLNDAISLSPANTIELRELVMECKKISKDLLVALQTLKMKGKQTRWNSFVVALKEVWKKGEIDGLFNRLAEVQSQVAVHLQFLLLNNVSDLSRLLQDLQLTSKAMGLENRNELQELKKRILQATDVLAREELGKTKMQMYLELKRTSQEIDPQMITDISTQMQDLSLNLKCLREVGKDTISDHQVLKSLYFSNILTRHHNIENAHTKTFDWIFECSDPASDNSWGLRFVEWLRKENGIFWIQGKAGSGKSTLMKFLCNHPTVAKHLQHWAQVKTLTIAKFFFWNAGTAQQKSQEGLLRSLLFEILRQCPELMPLVKNARSEVGGYDHDQNPWSQDELLSIYRAIMKQDVRIRFCFFIDGLDEYEERNRSHSDLVRTLRDLDHSSDIKLCVSSRPWAVFEDEFGKDSTWVLKLEDLTRGDIHQYVRDKFDENSRFQQLRKCNPSYDVLIQEVVNRAQGVFLWIFLVVRNLLEGLTYGDSIRTLRSRLESFPEDLDDFFQHMITSIPKIYRCQTARIFEIACSAEHPLLLMFYSFLDDVEDNPRSAFERLDPLSEEETCSRQDEMRRRLDGRTKGLLEVVSSNEVMNFGVDLSHDDDQAIEPYFKLKVDFLHRTVRDFLLNSKDTRLLLQQSLDEGGDTVSGTKTFFLACHAVLTEMKVSPYGKRDDGEWMRLFLRELFDFYHKALPGLPVSKITDPLLRDAEETYFVLKTRHQWSTVDSIFIGIATQFDLHLYLERRLAKENECRLKITGRPILDYALSLRRSNWTTCQISPRVVKVLLEYGADPNEPYDGSTVWGRFIGSIASGAAHKEVTAAPGDLFDIVQDLLLHGADINQKVHILPVAADRRQLVRGGRPFATADADITENAPAQEVILKCFPEEQSTLLLSTRPLRNQKSHGSWLEMFRIGWMRSTTGQIT